MYTVQCRLPCALICSSKKNRCLFQKISSCPCSPAEKFCLLSHCHWQRGVLFASPGKRHLPVASPPSQTSSSRLVAFPASLVQRGRIPASTSQVERMLGSVKLNKLIGARFAGPKILKYRTDRLPVCTDMCVCVNPKHSSKNVFLKH
jgi:hypothetical protein